MAYTIMIDAGHGGPCTEIGHSLHFNRKKLVLFGCTGATK